jgi:hypothetical protein
MYIKRSIYQVGIPLTSLTLSHFCACPKPWTGFTTSLVMVLLCSVCVPVPSQDPELLICSINIKMYIKRHSICWFSFVYISYQRQSKCSFIELVIRTILLWKEILNSDHCDSQQFHQYQQNEQSLLTSSLNTRKDYDSDVVIPGPGLEQAHNVRLLYTCYLSAQHQIAIHMLFVSSPSDWYMYICQITIRFDK